MGATHRVLIVEDEADLADLLAYNLRKAGYETEVARDGRSGLHRVSEMLPDLVILDIMLPQMSGLQVARQIRTNPRTAGVPIIMLTAKAEEVDQIAGLQTGADDYMTKPFSIKVLLARVEAMLRRTRQVGQNTDLLSFGPIVADLSTHEVAVDGEPIRLTLTEFRLLVALLRKPGKVLSRADLMYSAMGPAVLVTTRTIDVHVASIRKKLGDHGNMIRTIRGVGYLIEEEGAAVAGAEEFEVDELEA